MTVIPPLTVIPAKAGTYPIAARGAPMTVIPAKAGIPPPSGAQRRRIPLSLQGERTPRRGEERVLRTGRNPPHHRHSPPHGRHSPSYRHSCVGRNPFGAQAPHPPLPRRGEDAANTAGEGTAVGRRNAPRLPNSQAPHSAPAPETRRRPIACAIMAASQAPRSITTKNDAYTALYDAYRIAPPPPATHFVFRCAFGDG